MIEAYGTYELKLIDVETNEVKQTITQKNKLTINAILAISSGMNLFGTSTAQAAIYKIVSYNKKCKAERLFIQSTTPQITYQDFAAPTKSGTNPVIFQFFKRFSPPVATQTHAQFVLTFPQTYASVAATSLGISAKANIRAFNYDSPFHQFPISQVTLQTPCVQTTTDYLDLTYKISFSYTTDNITNTNADKHINYYKFLFRNNTGFSNNSILPSYYILDSYLSLTNYSAIPSYIIAPNIPSYYRDIKLFYSPRFPIRFLNSTTPRFNSLQGYSGGYSHGNAHQLVDPLTYKLASTTLPNTALVGQIINSSTIQRYLDRSNTDQYRNVGFVSIFPANTSKYHSPVFKHQYGCNGPFQDLNYLGASKGSITINSTNYTRKEQTPIFRRVDFYNTGELGVAKYSYKDFNFCGLPSWNGNTQSYPNYRGYFSIDTNYWSNPVTTYAHQVGYSGYEYSSITMPGLANAWAQGVSNDPYPEWNNNVDEIDKYLRSDFVDNLGIYRLVKRNPWSGETFYSTDNPSLASLGSVKQTAFNTATKEYLVASSTSGLWKISDDFVTIQQIDLTSYSVVSAQVYAVAVNAQQNIIYVLANGGLLISLDNCITFTKYTELNGFSISELNGVGGIYSNCLGFYCSNIHDTDLFINLLTGVSTHRVIRYNRLTNITTEYSNLGTGNMVDKLQFTSKLQPNIALEEEEDLVILAVNKRLDSYATNQFYLYINKYNEALKIICNKRLNDYNLFFFNTLSMSYPWYSEKARCVVQVIPIRILDLTIYHIALGTSFSTTNNTSGKTKRYVYNPIANTITTSDYYAMSNNFGGPTGAYSTPSQTGTVAVPLVHGISPDLVLYNQRTKLGYFCQKEYLDPKTAETGGLNLQNTWMACPQIMFGTGGIYRATGTILSPPNSGDNSISHHSCSMINGIPKYIGRHTAWREYMWNGYSWVMDEWYAAQDSSGNARLGTRKFFEHGYHVFNSSSYVSWKSATPLTSTNLTFAVTLKTDLYTTVSTRFMPIISTRHSSNKLRSSEANTAYHICWSLGTLGKLGVQVGTTDYANTALAATYATNTNKRMIFVLEGTTTKIYIDGSLVDTITHAAVTVNLYELFLGTRYDLFNHTAFFEGYLSNFQVWNQAWELSDVTYDYNNQTGIISDNPSATIPSSARLIHWKLDEDLAANELRVTGSTQTIPKKLSNSSTEYDQITIDFANGTGGSSFVEKESMTFATLDGVLKDNATTVTIPDVYQNFTQDKDESDFHTTTIPSTSYQVVNLPVFWSQLSASSAYVFNQVCAPQGTANLGVRSYLDFIGDFDFTIEPSNETFTSIEFGFKQVSDNVIQAKILLNATNVLSYNLAVLANTAAVHAYGDVYRFVRSGSTITLYRNATQLTSFSVTTNNLYAYVQFTSDAYAGISDCRATMYVPAGLVLTGNYLTTTGIFKDKDYNYSLEYYNLDAHLLTLNAAPIVCQADGSNQFLDTMSVIQTDVIANKATVNKYGFLFHSSDYGKTLGGTYRYRYIGI